MDGAGQGKEMRWDTERQRKNMKIYDGRCTHTVHIENTPSQYS